MIGAEEISEFGKRKISLEGFGAAKVIGATSVDAFDPLKGVVTFKNNKLTQGVWVNVGFVFGIYDETEKTIELVSFTADSTTYIWGSYVRPSAPAKGSSKDSDVYTYALNPSAVTTYDVLVFVGPDTTMTRYYADYGSGSRIIGIKWADLQPYLDTVYDTEIYLDVVTVTPWAPNAEITDFTIEKA